MLNDNALDSAQKHFLHLAQRDANNDGWATISATILPHWKKNIPSDLYELVENAEGGGKVRLTERGEALADYA